MTVRADRLTKRAKPRDRAGSEPSSDPASTVRVVVDALERLDYRMERLLADAGITRPDLDDPDGRIPCRVWVPMLCRALAERPMKNAGMRLAAETPIGAFPLIGYLIMTSHDVGKGLTRLARSLRLGEARSIPSVREDQDPIRVVLEGRDTPLSAEFSVTLNVLHFREETEAGFVPRTRRALIRRSCHLHDRHIDHVFGDEPHLEFVAADDVAHDQIVGPVVSGVRRAVRHSTRLLQHDLVCV
jgi:hypothetical protein